MDDATLPAARRRTYLTDYDPERGLKEIAVADAAIRHYSRGARSDDPLIAARNREDLYKAIENKITAQARYVIDRDSRVVPSQKNPSLRGRRGGFDKATPALHAADPGKIVAHRWRHAYCVVDNDGRAVAIEPTLLAEAIRDAQEKCIRAVERGMRRDPGESVPDDLPELDDRCRLILGDFRTAEIEPESIDCIITDPPYPQEFIPLYGDLVERAGVWLKPGGSLLAMAGELHLPRVLEQLESGPLRYQWTNCFLVPGQAVQVFPRKVQSQWKPVFWYVKGEYDGPSINDVFKSNNKDVEEAKGFHPWGQTESGMAGFVRAFSKPGDIVCDPFMGGGTTGVVSLGLDRLFVGIELNEETFNTAKARIARSAPDAESAPNQ